MADVYVTLNEAAELEEVKLSLIHIQMCIRDSARRGYDVTGIDITPAYIDYANEQAKKENLNAKFITGTQCVTAQCFISKVGGGYN